MPKPPDADFFDLLGETPVEERRAPSRLKSKVYSALMKQAAESGPLRSLPRTKAAGHGLCVFEQLVTIAPVGTKVKALNLCRICHGRILGERMENAPIFWGHCPYVKFQGR